MDTLCREMEMMCNFHTGTEIPVRPTGIQFFCWCVQLKSAEDPVKCSSLALAQETNIFNMYYKPIHDGMMKNLLHTFLLSKAFKPILSAVIFVLYFPSLVHTLLFEYSLHTVLLFWLRLRWFLKISQRYYRIWSSNPFSPVTSILCAASCFSLASVFCYSS